jgi:PAS domain S-box-containing protein
MMTKSSVLIAEDEGILAIELKKRLEKLGYKVLAVASSGEEAIELAARHKPDLILMDIVLKGEMDGIEAADKIRGFLNVPVIYLTAYSDEDTVKRAKLTEPFGYLVKPYNDKELQIALEVTLYRHSMEKLRESHHWLETVLRSMSDSVIATDSDGRITFVNPSAERLTGLKHTDVAGKRLEDVIRIIDEETGTPAKAGDAVLGDKGEAAKGEAAFATTATNTAAASASNPAVSNAAASTKSSLIIAADGRKVPVEYRASPIVDVQEVKMGMVLVFKDLTMQREAEAESKIREMAMASSINALLITDLQGRIKYVNAPFYELWGYGAGEVIGGPVGEICPIDKAMGDIGHSLREEGRWIGETAAVKKDGTDFFMRLEVNIIKDRLARPIYIMYSFVDITELKKAKEELKKYTSRLHRSDVETGEIAEDLSENFERAHESIQRLHAVLSKDYAHIMNDEAGRCLTDAKSAIEKTGGLVEEFIQSNLPLSFYITLIELYQLKIEDFSCREGYQDHMPSRQFK